MQIELRKLVKKVGITTICVTHDQIEALTISDRIAIMSEGRIDQIGNPPEIYEHPQTEFVAEFLGVANLFSRKVNNGVVQLASGLEIPTEYHGDVTVVLRPEDLCIAPEIRDKGWTGTVSYTRLLGPTIELEVVIDEQERPLRGSVGRRDGSEISVGKRVNISLIDPRNTVVIPLKAKL